MDAKKKKELEELRKQINPEVLARVAKAMGAPVPPTVGGPAAPAAPAKTAAPSKSPSAPARGIGKADSEQKVKSNLLNVRVPEKKDVRTRQMQELQNRIRRREMELEKQRPKEKQKTNVAFVVFDTAHFRAKQVMAYLQKMEFNKSIMVNDESSLAKAVIERLNNPDIVRTVYAVSVDVLPQFNELLSSEALEVIRQKIPGLAKLPIFVFNPPNKPPISPQGVQPNYFISMVHNPDFSAKKVRAALQLPK